ncbi:hypothetical protein BT63DRAFT_432925 [Microthyrium microscopicum]|uniref:Metallo-beta-lactamase domain-containing protein n=1 Tax=Microthyrium microscopicum TaxID=703497 RepID=A0A6A6UC99_9PEZI|nr:hypothetical protein BT63DRAFT_432925 [Microthyrium microscopicum]
MTDSKDLALCATCGTQFDAPLSSPPDSCNICDDPRQYVPPTGQAWTSLRELDDGNRSNKWEVDHIDPRVSWVSTHPKSNNQGDIGQRAFLLETPHGNVLWDMIAYIDDKTIEHIKAKGGLKAIVISHPHYYTTHIHWAKVFNCPVYTGAEDKQWFNRSDPDNFRRLIHGTEAVLAGVTAVKTGGHFDGSLVLHWENKLFIADTIMIIPSGLYDIDRPAGTASYSFMWSYPNMIPLWPDAILGIWEAVKPFDFDTAYGAFDTKMIRSKYAKKRLLESMKIFITKAGHLNHALFEESL